MKRPIIITLLICANLLGAYTFNYYTYKEQKAAPHQAKGAVTKASKMQYVSTFGTSPKN